MSFILTDENFEKEIINTDKLVLVDFFANWCEPCSVLAPILEKLADDFKGKFVLMKANLDNNPLSAQKFNIEQIPTVILFKKGKPINGFVGLSNQTAIKEWLENIIKENEETSTNDNTGEELVKEFTEHAKKNNIRLNPNKEVVKRIIDGLLKNEKKYGKKYCPCRRVTGDIKEDEKKICPCYYHKDEIEKDGRCLCGLFVK